MSKNAGIPAFKPQAIRPPRALERRVGVIARFYQCETSSSERTDLIGADHHALAAAARIREHGVMIPKEQP
ncbi:MAG TPA: hypothetical protein VFN25_12535 [Dokdonella sp.]|uniref:hypothetical protein n=1 Tax=Dokdonella sp. TaxID=2291710 RepID=UPI002D7E6704|nr:hypothetical protein [Dokdonella sp.]HET9033718.1 hypothetical protein [Dokdonella sp.]